METTDQTTTRFDFVTDDKYRESLESDYCELCACLKANAWKMAHVAAGSIVEALLIDWLGANGVPDHNGKDLLQMDLGTAVKACEAHNLISERASNLTTVVRDFRNLIHPGRLIRTKGKVDKSGAEVAKALVDMIVQEIAELKAQTYGYTAEQIASKVVNDPASVSFIAHLLRETKDNEKERLLLKILPHRYREFADVEYCNGQEIDQILNSLSRCYREAFRLATDEIKRKAVANYVTILKNPSDSERRAYEEAFFLATDLCYCGAQEAELIVDHLLSRIKETHGSLKMYEGIGHYLHDGNWKRFVELLLPWATGDRQPSIDACLELLRNELHRHMKQPIKCQAFSYLQQLERQRKGNAGADESVRQLQSVIRNQQWVAL